MFRKTYQIYFQVVHLANLAILELYRRRVHRKGTEMQHILIFLEFIQSIISNHSMYSDPHWTPMYSQRLVCFQHHLKFRKIHIELEEINILEPEFIKNLKLKSILKPLKPLNTEHLKNCISPCLTRRYFSLLNKADIDKHY